MLKDSDIIIVDGYHRYMEEDWHIMVNIELH